MMYTCAAEFDFMEVEVSHTLSTSPSVDLFIIAAKTHSLCSSRRAAVGHDVCSSPRGNTGLSSQRESKRVCVCVCCQTVLRYMKTLLLPVNLLVVGVIGVKVKSHCLNKHTSVRLLFRC